MVTVRVRENGPLVISEDGVEIIGPDGRHLATEKSPVALCRCGYSESKPFCDGAHHHNGFQPDIPSSK